jgi:hypothetical protein
MKTTATEKQLNDALNYVNSLYQDNIKFKTGPDRISKNKVKFTLTVKDSRGPGSRRSYNGRRICAACWHVHGHFFEYLFNIAKVNYIESLGKVMRDNSDNWEDRNLGSMYRPFYHSNACDCE